MTANDFQQFITQMRFGSLHDELTDQLQELTRACTETGKAGEMTLTIKLVPGKSGQIEITDSVKVKTPEFSKGTTLMFATPDGRLQREDPRQITMELRTIDTEPKGEPRRVG